MVMTVWSYPVLGVIQIYILDSDSHSYSERSMLNYSQVKDCMNDEDIYLTKIVIFTQWYKNSSKNSKLNVVISPIKEKYSKTSTWKYVLPHERISIVNPKGGMQRGITEREYTSITNPKGVLRWRQKGILLRWQQEKFNEDPSWRQK